MSDESLKLEDVEADSKASLEDIPEAQKIKSLAALAREQIEIEDGIAQLEKNLLDMKDHLKKVSEFQIPELFNELGLEEFKLANGFKVKVGPYYQAKITDEKAFDWLEDRGHADIVKGEFIIHYRRNNVNDLAAFKALAAQMGFTVSDKLGVHPMTLKAFVRNQIETGQEIDRELFNVFTGFKTKIGR